MESSLRPEKESLDLNQNSKSQKRLKAQGSSVHGSKVKSSAEESDSVASREESHSGIDASDVIIDPFETALKSHSSEKPIKNIGLSRNISKDTLNPCDTKLSIENEGLLDVTEKSGKIIKENADNSKTGEEDNTNMLPNHNAVIFCGHFLEAKGSLVSSNVKVLSTAVEEEDGVREDGVREDGVREDGVREDEVLEDSLEFVANHFTENSDDEANDLQEEKVLIKEMSDVGRYSYACLIAHSLHTLFGYSSANKKFQDMCMKLILRRLGHDKRMQKTMLMVLRGEISMGLSDPLVDSLKKEFPNPVTGSLAVMEDLLEMALKEGVYDARMRTLLKFLSLLFGVVWEDVEDLEDRVQRGFRDEEHEPTEEEKREKLDKIKSRKIKRIAIVAIAAIGGGALIGLTAGIAAPLIAVGAGAVIGGVGAAGLGTVAGAAIIGSIFGVAGAGLTGFKMKKRIGELEEFEFEPLTHGQSLHVTVAVSGWLNEKHTDFRGVWLGLANSREQYILRYESKYLRELGNAMDYIANIAITAAVKHTLKQTLLSGLLAAISWPLTLLSVASVIDNPWSICTQRSVNAGRQLAEVLLSRQQGRRPVTLVGFSFGARVIFSCLEEMSSRKNSEGIVEDVVLLGAPVSGCVEDWSRLEKVVAGRIVNGYCRGDWLLKFMYRTASAQLTIAGLAPIKWENRRMHNIDLTDIVSGHLDYFNQIDMILNSIGVKTVEHAEVGSSESLKQWTSLRRSDDGEESDATHVATDCDESLGKIDEEISESGSTNLPTEAAASYEAHQKIDRSDS